LSLGLFLKTKKQRGFVTAKPTTVPKSRRAYNFYLKKKLQDTEKQDFIF